MKALRTEALAISAVAATIAAMEGYRAWGVEPAYWLQACGSAAPPLGCLPRAALQWAQYWSLWGIAALATGAAAFLLGSRRLGILAVALGAAAVINWNASWGMLGLALGGWAWINPAPEKHARAAAVPPAPPPAPPTA
jgi:hypothetical protein